MWSMTTPYGAHHNGEVTTVSKVTSGGRLDHFNISQYHILSSQDLPLCIKWPNDLYFKGEAKLGGILVTTFSMGQQTTAVIGKQCMYNQVHLTSLCVWVCGCVGGCERVSLGYFAQMFVNHHHHVVAT